MSGIREKTCYKCDETIYEIDGKMATTRDGKQFLQKWNDIQGTIPHYRNCKGRQETTMPKPDKTSNQLSFDNKLMMLENRLIILEKLISDLVQQQQQLQQHKHGWQLQEEAGFQE